jgi:hypothetical protein
MMPLFNIAVRQFPRRSPVTGTARGSCSPNFTALHRTLKRSNNGHATERPHRVEVSQEVEPSMPLLLRRVKTRRRRHASPDDRRLNRNSPRVAAHHDFAEAGWR